MAEREKPPRAVAAVPHADGLHRCPWPGVDPLYVAYHDEEWGAPEYDDRALFEKLVLDGFQAGLSWITILRKRPAFRNAFDGFDPERIVRWDEAKNAALMTDAGIVRNRAKIEATQALARIALDLMAKGGFARHLWSFVGGRPLAAARGASATSRSRAPSRGRWPRTCGRGAAISSVRRSSMPSCRRPAWSTTTSSTAAGMRPAARSPAIFRHERAPANPRMAAHAVGTAARHHRPVAPRRRDRRHRAWPRAGRALERPDPRARIFSVAQHALLVEALFSASEPPPPTREKLAALLHDGPEYVIGDLISPFKAAVGGDYRRIETRLMQAIHIRFGLPGEPSPELARRIKAADRLSAYLEATTLAGFAEGEARKLFGEPPVPVRRFAAFLEPMRPDEAEARFLARSAELDGAAGKA